ncbi:MAG: aminotransferase class IV family protein [Pseudomonadota bacterium]
MENAICRPTESDFRLIETFRFDPGTGFHDLSRHLHRMEQSAAVFDIAFDRRGIEAELAAFNAEETMRCRLTLDSQGQSAITSAPLGKPLQSWAVTVSPVRLKSNDPWLRHKTTRREVYDSARRDMPAGIDELLFLNERDEICEGTITNVFATLRDGSCVTPPLTSGCLPGILRQSLLDENRVREQAVTMSDLRDAHSISVGNSLRGEIAVDYFDPCDPPPAAQPLDPIP